MTTKKELKRYIDKAIKREMHRILDADVSWERHFAETKLEKMKLRGEALSYLDRMYKKMSSLTGIPVDRLERMNYNQIDDAIDELNDVSTGKAKQADQLFDAIREIFDAMRRINSIEFIPHMRAALKHTRKLA